MTRARDISNVITDANLGGTLDVSGAFTSQGIDDNADANAITIDSSERVGIGNTTPDGGKLHVTNSTGAIGYFQSTQASANVENIILNSTQTNSSANLSFQINDGTTAKGQLRLNGDNSIAIHNTTSLTERMRIDSSGRMMIGTTTEGSTSADNLTIADTSHAGITIRSGTSSSAAVYFSDGTSGSDELRGFVNYAHGTNAMTFGTDASERMRILSGGDVCINDTASGTGSFSAPHLHVTCDASKNGVGVENHRQNYAAYVVQADNDTGSRFALYIINGSGLEAGKISYTSSSTTFATTSDYRLKENVKYDFDATSRLKQLKPCRFNFKIDTDNTVDGFLAHEVSSIVPEAILGEKDATKEDGSIAPQSIDQAKIVPLLTKALQEALTRIDTLEAEVKTLKGE
jgi:hypothetical protein